MYKLHSFIQRRPRFVTEIGGTSISLKTKRDEITCEHLKSEYLFFNSENKVLD